MRKGRERSPRLTHVIAIDDYFGVRKVVNGLSKDLDIRQLPRVRVPLATW